MKKFFILFFLFVDILFAQISKSAVVYYGNDISYTTLGVHDYIIVQPNHIDTAVPGFQIYKDKIYAYVSIGELDKTLDEYKKLQQNWIKTDNKNWNSVVLDIKNKDYQEFLFQTMIEPLRKKGFQNFFFDTLDSYQLYSANQEERKENEKALAGFINEFHKRYPQSKLVVNRGFEIMDDIHDSIEAVLFESYYSGTSGAKKHPYKKVSSQDREWFDFWLNKVRFYKKDIISVEYMSPKDIYGKKGEDVKNQLLAKGMIPYIANRDLDLYGVSTKEAVKREIFTLISEKRLDRTLQDSHQLGALILEYMGYKQRLYPIEKPLPKPENMHHYAGVMIWLRDYAPQPKKLVKWVKKLVENNIKVVFMGNFGFILRSGKEYKFLGIKVKKRKAPKIRVVYKGKMIGYEVEPPLTSADQIIKLKKGTPLLTYEYADLSQSTAIALTPWGGYMVGDDAVTVNIENENLWIANPFLFFQQALHLKPLPVADVTTQNGKRLLFTHVDGDGLANRVEGDFGYYSGDVILNQILKKYHIPHSISIIGAELDKNGYFGKYRKELTKLVQDMYKLDNVEGATHTFTHPFFWGKIKNNNLDPQYRLKVKGYKFSLQHEMIYTLRQINTELYPKGKTPKAKTVFWSGDCTPLESTLSFVYRHKILAINGGDTTITRTSPWLNRIAPLGLERGGYTQIYTGAQNENVFTNDWLGPFWGFKNVTQTFEMTNSPRRYKPIDIYYHLYSGSKQASIEALKYVFNWAMKQDTFPIYTSRYIPKVIEFYNYALENKGEHKWIFYGLNTLNTVRIEEKNLNVSFQKNVDITGIKHFENHTYLSLYTKNKKKALVDLTPEQKKDEAYMVSANGYINTFEESNTTKKYSFESNVALKMDFHLPQECKINVSPKADKEEHKGDSVYISYQNNKKAEVILECY